MEGSTKEERNLKEEEWIAKFWDKQALCYNFKKTAEAKERSCYSNTPEKTREIQSGKQKGKKRSLETRRKMSVSRKCLLIKDSTLRFRLSTSQIVKSGTNTGKTFSAEHKDNISKSQRKTFHTSLCSPNGELVKEINGLNAFCKLHNLLPSEMSALLAGKVKSHRGWKMI
jgi:hypothetical protein